MINYPTVIGIVGAGLVLLAFCLNQFHIWKDDEMRYDAVNMLGGIFLIVYALMLSAYPFAILNGVWALVSFRDLINDLRNNPRN